MTRRPALSIAVTALLLAACAGPGQAPAPVRAKGKAIPGAAGASPAAATNAPPTAGPRASGSTAPGPGLRDDAGKLAGTLRATAAIAAGILSNNGGSIISDNGGGLISDKGGSIISDNGGGIVGNNGARYRTLALGEQRPVAGATVRLRDAAGNAVNGPDGKPLVAVTDAEGRFAFPIAPDALPADARNLVAEVDMAPGKGSLRAIAPRGADRLEIDVVAALTGGYILDQYVATQADKRATLDKLPADVERDTRAKAAAALAGVAPPATLTAADVAATLDAARKIDPAFDAQMEAVKRLLVVGQADLGSGRPGTEVAFSTISAPVAAPDGSLYFCTWLERRIWRLAPDGTVSTAVGAGPVTPDLALGGKKAADVGLLDPSGLAIDAQGRLVFAEISRLPNNVAVPGLDQENYGGHYRVTRLEPDGTLTELAPLTEDQDDFGGDVVGMYLAADGSPRLLYEEARVVDVKTGATTRFDTGDLDWSTAFALDPAGGMWALNAHFSEEDEGELYRLATGAPPTLVLAAARDGLAKIVLGHDGEVLTLSKAGKLAMRRPDGTTTTLMEQVPAGFTMTAGGMLGTGGDAFVVSTNFNQSLYRIRGGVATLLAGNGGGTSGDAKDLALSNPLGLAVAPDGAKVIADFDANRVLRVAADGESGAIAGTGAFDTTGTGGPATKAAIKGPRVVRVGPDGRVSLIDFIQRVLTIDPDGTLRLLHDGGPGEDLLALPTGELLAVGSMDEGTDPHFELRRIDPAKGTDAFVARWDFEQRSPTRADREYALAPAPGGGAYLMSGVWLSRWTPDGGVVDVRKLGSPPAGLRMDHACLATDPQGRIIVTQGKTIWRYDVAADAFTKIAGPGTGVLAGDKPDTGIGDAHAPAFDANGDLLFADADYKQIKRIPAADL